MSATIAIPDSFNSKLGPGFVTVAWDMDNGRMSVHPEEDLEVISE